MHDIYSIITLVMIYGGTAGVIAVVVRCFKLKEKLKQAFSRVVELETQKQEVVVRNREVGEELNQASSRIAELEVQNQDVSQRLDQASSRTAELETKYKDVIDLEAFKENIRREISNLDSQQKQISDWNQQLQAQTQQLGRELNLYTSELTVIDCGLYTPAYDFDISQKYKDELDRIRERQKDSLKNETAAICTQNWTVNGSASEGKKQTKAYTRLMLRAFNGEADALIANVRWNNVQKMIDRLEGIFQAINKLGEVHTIRIQRDYFQFKLQELKITYEYQEKLKAEKDEQRRIQEQIREEERAQREFERQIKESEDEERRSQMALERARQQLQEAQGAEVAKMNARIVELEQQVAEATANKERAKSMAEMTKCGHVYIISNIGSFGENRFKIGLTRRLTPTDRVDELNNASVPFEFDIHATIYSENAPQLEAKLHERFSNRRLNLVNRHKEFFECSLDEIEAAVREYNADIEFVKIPEAKAYRQTLVLRSTCDGNAAAPTNGRAAIAQQVRSPAMSQPEPVGQVYVYTNNQKYGPYTSDQIRGYIKAGNFDAATSVFWRDGMADWAPLPQLN